jgi:hypothetical protein
MTDTADPQTCGKHGRPESEPTPLFYDVVRRYTSPEDPSCRVVPSAAPRYVTRALNELASRPR